MEEDDVEVQGAEDRFAYRTSDRCVTTPHSTQSIDRSSQIVSTRDNKNKFNTLPCTQLSTTASLIPNLPFQSSANKLIIIFKLIGYTLCPTRGSACHYHYDAKQQEDVYDDHVCGGHWFDHFDQ